MNDKVLPENVDSTNIAYLNSYGVSTDQHKDKAYELLKLALHALTEKEDKETAEVVDQVIKELQK